MKLLRSGLGESRTRLDIDIARRAGSPTVVELEGDLVGETIAQLRSCVDEQVRHGAGDLVIDLSGVGFCDSATLGPLIGMHRRLADRGGSLELAEPPRAMRELLRVSGLDQVLRVT